MTNCARNRSSRRGGSWREKRASSSSAPARRAKTIGRRAKSAAGAANVRNSRGNRASSSGNATGRDSASVDRGRTRNRRRRGLRSSSNSNLNPHGPKVRRAAGDAAAEGVAAAGNARQPKVSNSRNRSSNNRSNRVRLGHHVHRALRNNSRRSGETPANQPTLRETARR